MFSHPDHAATNNNAASSNSIEDRLAQLTAWRPQVIVRLVAYGAFTFFAAVGSIVLMISRFAAWQNMLPPAAPQPTFRQLLNNRPDLFATSLIAGSLGAVLYYTGLLMWRRLFGADDRPPRLIVWMFTAMPLMFVVMGMGMTLTRGGVVVALSTPILLGYGLALVPLEIGALALALIQLARRQIREVPQPIEAENLPRNVAKYFSAAEVEALEAGLMPLGDFSYRPGTHKYRRCWMAASGGYFVDATWVHAGKTTLRAVGVFSATSDGHYFETVDSRIPGVVITVDKPDTLAHIDCVVGASLPELLERHFTNVTHRVRESDCGPLEFAADDLHALSRYGVAAQMRATAVPLLWLGNPYAGRALPPLPGTIAAEGGDREPAAEARGDTLSGAR